MNKLSTGLLVGVALGALGSIATVAPAAARPIQGINFSITLGDVMIGYSDGYYDRNRRWHAWRNSQERTWYQSNHRASFFSLRHDRDNDTNRRNWRTGRSQDWRGGRNH